MTDLANAVVSTQPDLCDESPLAAPVELTLDELREVSGGLPNGTWRMAATAALPNGTW